jgi:succinate dehydrogenase / fumarate reductase membrane anchor subunit
MTEPVLPRASMRTGLGRVRGLGSARDGVAHWWAQRATAVALVPLSLWFVLSVATMAGASQAEVQAWIASPLVSVLLLLLVVATFQHLSLGLQVVIEDYIRHEETRVAMLLAQRFACIVLGLASVLAILRVAL